VIDCPFALNFETGLWQCPDCGYVYKKKSDKPPRRNCPAKLTPEAKAQRQAAMAEQERAAAHGAGTQLHKLLKRLTGEGITASCGCKSHIATMNLNGPAWCRENVDTIVGWLEEEIERRVKEPRQIQEKIWELEERLEKIYSTRNEIVRNEDLPGRDYLLWEKSKEIQLVEKELDQHDAKLKASAPGWQLKLAGWKLPGQRLAIKQLVMTAIRLAERADRKTNE
jgi:rubredoxin